MDPSNVDTIYKVISGSAGAIGVGYLLIKTLQTDKKVLSDLLKSEREQHTVALKEREKRYDALVDKMAESITLNVNFLERVERYFEDEDRKERASKHDES